MRGTSLNSSQASTHDDELLDQLVNKIVSHSSFHHRWNDATADIMKRFSGKEGVFVDLKTLARRDLYLFLEKYGEILEESDLEKLISPENGDEVRWYLSNRLDQRTSAKTVGNRRYKMLQQLINEGEYFSDEAIQNRQPELFQLYVGQYRSEKFDPKMNLSDRILRNYDLGRWKSSNGNNDLGAGDEQRSPSNASRVTASAMRISKGKRRDPDLSSDESELESDEEDVRKGQTEKQETNDVAPLKDDEMMENVTDEEKSELHEQLVKLMHERFLAGLDDFDYSKVDNDTKFDDWRQMQQDAEDAYFDE